MRIRGLAMVAVALAVAAVAAWAKGGNAPPAGPPTFPPTIHTVVLEDSQGRPAAGGTVRLLDASGSDERNQWVAPDAEGTADGTGLVKLSCPNDMANPRVGWELGCFFAWRGDEAVFGCRSKLVEGARIRLAPGKRVVGRVVGPDGKPLTGARARVAIAGSEEWHYVDAEIAADGSLKSPPFPPEALKHAETHVEARAPGFVDVSVPISLASIDKPIEVRFAAARRVRGKVKADDPVLGAVLHTSDYHHGPQATVAADGTFVVDGIAPATRRLYLTSKSHAPRILELTGDKSDVDLGVVALARGHAVAGKIAKGGMMTVGLVDDQGVGVAWIDTDQRAVYEFAHVDAGIDHVAARIGGAGGELWVFERGKLDGEHDVPPFALTFEDAYGKRQLVASAQITWSGGGRKETTNVRMFSYTLGVTVVRFHLPGPGALRIEIDGAEPIELKQVDVDAFGHGSAKVVVAK